MGPYVADAFDGSIIANCWNGDSTFSTKSIVGLDTLQLILDLSRSPYGYTPLRISC